MTWTKRFWTWLKVSSTDLNNNGWIVILMHAILCFGASITFGRGAVADKGWVSLLTDAFASKDKYNVVYNLGICGDGTADLLERMETECKARIVRHRPGDRYDIIISIGINDTRIIDGKPQLSQDAYRTNMLRILDIAKKYGDSVSFVGLTPVDEELTNPYEDTVLTNARIQEFDKVAQDCCKERAALFIPMFDLLMQHDLREILEDGLHPDEKGYSVMFDVIKKKIEKIL